MSALPLSSLPPDLQWRHEYPALVVMQPTTFCNIDCRYCWLPDRHVNARMPLEVAHKTIEFFVSHAPPGGSVVFLWHSGEPTSVGLDYFAALLDVPTGRQDVRVRHKIQTNATLLTDEWCELLRRRQIDVGVSLDGPQHVHDKHRVRRSGAGSFNETMRGIRLLQKHGIRVSNLAVISDYSLDYPEEIYDFFRSSGLNIVGYSVEQIEGTHESSQFFSRIETESSERYLGFLSRLYRRWRDDDFAPVIREFDWVVRQALGLLRDPHYTTGSDQTKPLKIIAVAADGDIVTFSPELITGSAEDRRRFVIGNILQLRDFGDLVRSSALDRLAREVGAGVDKCRHECLHFAICGGGSVSSKYFELGSVSVTETAYCRTHKKLMFDCISQLLSNDDINAYLARRSPRNGAGIKPADGAAREEMAAV